MADGRVSQSCARRLRNNVLGAIALHGIFVRNQDILACGLARPRRLPRVPDHVQNNFRKCDDERRTHGG